MSKATEPVILTQEQIQAIGALLKNTDEWQALRAVRFRRDHLVAVNGHLLLRVPLEPAERDSAVDGVLLAKWTYGFGRKARMQIDGAGGAVTVTALSEGAKSTPRGHVVLPAWSVSTTANDAAIENIFTLFKPDAPLTRFAVSHRYLDMAREFVDVEHFDAFLSDFLQRVLAGVRYTPGANRELVSSFLMWGAAAALSDPRVSDELIEQHAKAFTEEALKLLEVHARAQLAAAGVDQGTPA
jgi:hypothetical protein